ncbi:MAG: ABC transporter permease [Acidimicrobiia bacterium]|nr:ABC transporter permease [Acidimicrobiia bacterium]
MPSTETEEPPESEPTEEHSGLGAWLIDAAVRTFLAVGVLPILLLGLVIFFGIIEPRFLSGDNVFNVSRQLTYLGIITMGQAVVLMSGGFDLSVGGTVALTSVVAATIMSGQIDGGSSLATALTLGILGGLAVGLVVGIANGFAVAILKVTPFVVTLAMSSITYGLALMVADGAPVSGVPIEFARKLGTGKLWGVPAPVWVALVLLVVMTVLMGRTRFGRYVYAIGGNEKAARLSGISVWRTTALVYVICSVLAAIAGIMLTARVSSGEPNLGGSFPLESIAAAVLGGVALGGGQGRLLGAVGGAAFVVMLQNGMNLIRVENYVQQIVIGIALITAVVVDRLRDVVRART